VGESGVYRTSQTVNKYRNGRAVVHVIQSLSNLAIWSGKGSKWISDSDIHGEFAFDCHLGCALTPGLSRSQYLTYPAPHIPMLRFPFPASQINMTGLVIMLKGARETNSLQDFPVSIIQFSPHTMLTYFGWQLQRASISSPMPHFQQGRH
jgi:hypothetical protein